MRDRPLRLVSCTVVCYDIHLQRALPVTYQHSFLQVWAVNSAGRAGSPWARGQSGPAPPEGVLAPSFLQIHATSAVVEITPPTQPNGPVGLYRVLAESKDAQLLVRPPSSLQAPSAFSVHEKHNRNYQPNCQVTLVLLIVLLATFFNLPLADFCRAVRRRC